jgi:hypothetical protein
VPLWSGNSTSINSKSKYLDAGWELARFLALGESQNVLSRVKVVTPALRRSLSIPGDFETPPPAHVRVFREVAPENTGSWDYHPRFSEVEVMVAEELAKGFKNEKTMHQTCKEIDARADLIIEQA